MHVFDDSLRKVKDSLIEPVAAAATHIGLRPIPVTLIAAGVGIAAAICAGFGLWLPALVFWLCNRVLDGLDGALARRQGRSSELGAYLDIMSDFFVYAALPLGIALGQYTAGQGSSGQAIPELLWPLTAFLLASFYVNAASWMYLAAIIEKRGAQGEHLTSLVMPRGLIEGTETIVFFTLVLLVPGWTPVLFGVFALLVLISALQRMFVWTIREKS